jgi:hypothetical protein
MLKSIAPVEALLQRMFVLEDEAAITAGSVMLMEAEAVQPLASVML